MATEIWPPLYFGVNVLYMFKVTCNVHFKRKHELF